MKIVENEERLTPIFILHYFAWQKAPSTGISQ